MNPLIVIGLLACVPVLLMLLLRVNAAFVYLTLGAGTLLAQYLGDDVMRIFDAFLPSASTTAHAAVRISLLVLPAALTILFAQRSINGTKYLLNIVPALLTGIVTVILVVPLLPDGAKFSVVTSSTWTSIQQFQGTAIGAATLSSCLLLWMTHKSPGKRAHKKR